MAKIALLLMFLVAAASLSMVLGACDYQSCPVPTYGDDDVKKMCRAALSYLDCVEKKGKSPDCSAAEKNAIDQVVTETKAALKQYGCGASSLVSSLVVTLGLSSVVYFLTSSQ